MTIQFNPAERFFQIELKKKEDFSLDPFPASYFFPVLPRGDAHGIPERPAERERITVTALTSNEFDPFRGMLEQFRRQLDPELLDQTARRDPRIRMQKLPPDRFRSHVEFLSQCFQRDVFREMTPHIIADPVEQFLFLRFFGHWFSRISSSGKMQCSGGAPSRR